MALTYAKLIDALPNVANPSDRDARFPSPDTNQKIYVASLNAIQQWDGATWQTIFLGTGTAGSYLYSGTGSPEGAVTAAVSSVYLQTDGTNGKTFWVKRTGTGNTGWALVSTSLGYYNVKDYGAKGDGATDDTAALIAAIAAASAAGGGTVRCPEGSYLLTGAVAVPSRVRVIGDGPQATIFKRGASVTMFTVTAANYVEFADCTLDGQYGTYTGKGIVVSGSCTRPVFRNIRAVGLSATHLEFGADAGEFAWVDGWNSYPGTAQTDYRAIHLNGPDTGAKFRRFIGVQCTLGYIDLDGPADTQFVGSGFSRIETDSACNIVSVVGCVWANLGAAMTLSAATMDVHGCRMAGDVTLDTTFTGSFIGNTQTSGTFTDNSAIGNALVYHHPLATSYAKVGKNIFLPQGANATETVQTDRTATTGDGDITQTYLTSAPTRIYSTTLTADRTVTLSTTGALAGATFTILRTAGGLFKVDVGGLVNLYQNQWCVVRYTGAAWTLVKFGSLTNVGQPANVSVDNGDTSPTFTVGLSAPTQRFATALTTNRTITLSATNAVNGSSFTVVREATATGSSTLSVGGLILLNVGEWATVQRNASGAWQLIAAGLLAPETLPSGTVGTTQTANDNSTKLATTAYVDRATTHTGTTSAAPTGTSSATAVMMGLAGSITPTRGTKIVVMVTGQMANSTAGSGATVDIRYGTGAAPSNGAAVTGTLAGIAQTETSVSAAQRSGFSLLGKVTGLSVGTAYWFDVSLLAPGGTGTATVTGCSLVAFEVP